MSAKTSQARRAAFLKALEETGNQTLSAERAKVSRSWVQLHRSTDPAFDAACKAAIATAKASLTWAPDQAWGARGSNKPPGGWGHLDGEELVVRGSGGSGGGRRVQIARARLHQWTPRVEDRFLATLAATCNVKAACAEVGLSQASAYLHRERWPGFARRWGEAIAVGYARIEEALTQNGENLFSSLGLPPEAPMPPMSVEQAIHILHMHKNEVKELGGRPGRWRRPRTLDEVRPSLLRKLAAVVHGLGLSAADKAKDRRAYAARRRPLAQHRAARAGPGRR
ncbi:MAG: hypothetical protein QOD42_215 [Sphingomonadales bacterium]|jgi:hypothetical protein|nr:hypothetical protein [Sphingomonadales bacterium]